MIKPAYQKPIDAKTYNETLAFFDSLLRMLHPFMPFITEELWQALSERKDGESIMVAPMPTTKAVDTDLLTAFEKVKETISGIRTVRLQKNIPNKDSLELEILGEHNGAYNSVISKMGNITEIRTVSEKNPHAISFLVGTTEFAVPMGNNIDVDAEIEKLEAELVYLQGFLNSVMKKLGNEKFVANAKAEVVDAERKKQADAESKIKTIEETIQSLKK